MTRPACANPAYLRHVVRPSATAGETYCHLACLCGNIVADGDDSCGGLHPPEHGTCRCTVTAAYCLDCDNDFFPARYDDELCPSCTLEGTA